MTAKIAVVTGAGSGIGRAVALALGKVGYTLVVAGRKLPPLEDVAREAGSGAIAVTTDVADRSSVDALFARVRSAAPYADLSLHMFEGVLDMLSGRYPSDEFAELRARITWDRIGGRIRARDPT